MTEVSVRAALERARTLGFLGPGPIEVHLAHARAFADAVEHWHGGVPARFLDLGTGGGVPAFVLLDRWPECGAVLVESSHRRAEFLGTAATDLGWAARVEVLVERAEVVAHRPEHRSQYDVVTARSFAAPAVTAEIGAGFLRPGGWLVVSEPPHGDRATRWPDQGLNGLGLESARAFGVDDAHFVGVRSSAPAAADVPRSVGRPTKRPRW